MQRIYVLAVSAVVIVILSTTVMAANMLKAEGFKKALEAKKPMIIVDIQPASVKKGDVMSLVKFEVTVPAEVASVLATESFEDLDFKPGDTVKLVIKAIHVLPVKV